MTDHQRIKKWLSDGQWHCSTELDYMRDARKRMSELVKGGVPIEGISCDGRCGKVHKSKTLKMRRLDPSYLFNAHVWKNFTEAKPKQEKLFALTTGRYHD